MKRILFVFILFSLSVSAIPAQQKDLPIVAVLDLAGEGLSESEKNAITNLLISSIFETDLVAVIDRNQREQVLSEIAFSMSGCTDESCAIEVGKLLAADIMVIGSVDVLGSRISIDLKAMDVATSRIQGTYNNLYESVDDVVDSMDALGGQFVQNFTGQIASKKAMLKYEKLVPLFISCNVDGADVYIDGNAIGKIEEGTLTKAVNFNAEINLEVKMAGYYKYSGMVLMDTEKDLNIELELIEQNRFAFKAVFGGGIMGSVVFSFFPKPNWWYIDMGAGFTIAATSPLLVNFPVFLKPGSYIHFDDRNLIRPYVGGVVIYDLATLYGGKFLLKDPGLIRYGLNYGGYCGAEIKITDSIRVNADISIFINEFWQGLRNIIQAGIGFTVM